MNTESLDAMTDFLIALDKLGPHMEAVGKLCCAAVEHRRWGTSMSLAIHNLTREEFDSHEGQETHYPVTSERPREWWSKEVEVWKGEVDLDREPRVEGRIWMTLYTDEPPFEEDPNAGLGEDWVGVNGASQEPTQRV